MAEEELLENTEGQEINLVYTKAKNLSFGCNSWLAIKPVMVILTIPITIISLGLFLIVINALIIMMADYIVDGFQVNGFWWALIFSIILSIVTSILERLNGKPQVEDEE